MLDLVQSKKFQAAVVGIIVTALLNFVPGLPEEATVQVIGIILAFIVAQGLADFGKGETPAGYAPDNLLQSKKFQAAMVGIIVVVGSYFLPNISPEAATEIATVIVAYIGGQGLADFGKESKKILEFLGMGNETGA
jgi:hypothetical protein